MRILLYVLGAAIAAALGVTLWVQYEAPYTFNADPPGANPRALLLFHPSRDAGFSEEVAAALASGLREGGFAVDQATIGAKAPAKPEGYAVAAIVSNTFYGAPDWPTQAYLKRADLAGTPTLGVICGAGNTQSAGRQLESAIARANGRLIKIQHLWTSRPNDETRLKEPNRAVARDIAKRLGQETAANAMKPDPM